MTSPLRWHLCSLSFRQRFALPQCLFCVFFAVEPFLSSPPRHTGSTRQGFLWMVCLVVRFAFPSTTFLCVSLVP